MAVENLSAGRADPGEVMSLGGLGAFRSSGRAMSKAERRKKRKQKQAFEKDVADPGAKQAELRTKRLLTQNEDELISFVAKINKIYQDKLHRPAPFMTFVFCGMQSAGKSTVMERFMNAVLNIVQQGTGTRCPLDTTCIHDNTLKQPICELSGDELDEKQRGENLSVNDVFERITEVNKKLAGEDRFSTSPLFLIYRSPNVQNMRFVDTPGIISNKSDNGKDNREDIKRILRNEMKKPNSKLCVLLEPKEFDTNPIINFCDESFGTRENWIANATFLMTKFDKQLGDCSTCSKSNAFFKSFHQNKCFPHLVITPTLRKEDLPPPELFKARKKLLEEADECERDTFEQWNQELEAFYQEFQDGEVLLPETKNRIGFASAKQAMREIMLDDTQKRLPEVIASLRHELLMSYEEMQTLEEKNKFCDPKELRLVVGTMLIEIQRRIIAYLTGDLESSLKFPERLQTLDEEIDNEEEDEDWASRKLNHYSEKEDVWRQRIAEMEGEYPAELQANERFLGGKQYQRAIQFFQSVLLESLPHPDQFKGQVANLTGYLNNGLNRENWENAMVQVISVSMKSVSHPGINYLIKHVGSIFRRLFLLALDDVKEGEQFSRTFKMLPNAVERYLILQFEEALWKLMEDASAQTHNSLEPMYSTIDPTLPTYREYVDPPQARHGPQTYIIQNGQYVPSPTPDQTEERSLLDWAKERITAVASGSGKKAKEYLKRESRQRALAKKAFLPDKRTSMITGEEIDTILSRSFEYIVALMEFNIFNLKFQLNHYLFNGFKKTVNEFHMSSTNNANWDSLVQKDPAIETRIEELKDQISTIEESLKDVEAMQRRL